MICLADICGHPTPNETSDKQTCGLRQGFDKDTASVCVGSI